MNNKEREDDDARIEAYINTPGKLPMSAFRPKFSFKVSKGISGMDIDDMADPKRGYIIDWDVYLPSIDKNLQRGFVWTLDQKRELIVSILKGIRIAEITVIHYKDYTVTTNRTTTVRVIDGKQRLSSVIAFFKGEFGVIHEGKEYFFDDLSDQAKREILGCFRYDIAYEYPDTLIPDSEKIAWFEMINFAGTPQDIEHLRNLKS